MSRRQGLSDSPEYDRIGRLYSRHRRPEPRIAARITQALGDASTVLNIGAGTGSYEPLGPGVVAVEPSPVMISQRPDGAAPVVQAVAEALPFAAGSFDAALAVFTVHHWTDVRAGLDEITRVARRVVILTFDPAVHAGFWLLEDYLPESNDLPSCCPRLRRPPWPNGSAPNRSKTFRSRPTASTASTGRTGTGPRRISIPRSAPASRAWPSCLTHFVAARMELFARRPRRRHVAPETWRASRPRHDRRWFSSCCSGVIAHRPA